MTSNEIPQKAPENILPVKSSIENEQQIKESKEIDASQDVAVTLPVLREITISERFYNMLGNRRLVDSEIFEVSKAQAEQEIQKLIEDSSESKIDFKSIHKYYEHIKSLEIQIFLIETHISPFCPWCEAWKQNKIEREWFKNIHQVLGIEQKNVKVEEILCDWNALHGNKYIDANGIEQSYPISLDQYGRNYFYATGQRIQGFPAIKIRVASTLMGGRKSGLIDEDQKRKKKDDEDNIGWREQVFSKVGEYTNKTFIYRIGSRYYRVVQKIPQLKLIKAVLRYLRTLDPSYAKVAFHHNPEPFSQYHRHISHK